MYEFGERSKKYAIGVDYDLFECAQRALAKSRYDMTIPYLGGLRTAEEQASCYPHASKCDGYEIKSYHQSGYAIDIIPVHKGYKNTRALNYFANLMLVEWQIMLVEGCMEENRTLSWGGTFGSQGWDKPHYELREI